MMMDPSVCLTMELSCLTTTTTTTQYEEKLRNVLQQILSPHYQIQNDCHLNTLLSHLCGKEDKALGTQLLNLPVVTEWIPSAISLWETKPVNLAISSFVTNLTAILSKNEDLFTLYQSKNIYSRLFCLINVKGANIQPTIKLAYVKVLSALLQHKSGIQWIISNDIWKDCLNFCLDNETVYIIREGHCFLVELLTKSIDVNESFVRSVVSEIHMKFNTYDCDTGTLFPQIENESLERHLKPKLKLIVYILSGLLDSDMYKNRDYRVIDIFINRPNLELTVNKFNILTTNGEIIYDLDQILCYVKWFEMCIDAKGDKIESKTLYNYVTQIFLMVNNLILAKHILIVIRFCHFIDSLWNRLKDRLPSPLERPKGAPLLLQNQILVFEVLPVIMPSYIYCKQFCMTENDELRDDFLDTFFNLLCENTVRWGYMWRDALMAEPDCIEVSKYGLLQILNSIKIYNRSRGIYFFRTLTYSLRDYLDGFKDKPGLMEMFAKHSSYLISLMEALAEFIHRFDITWRDSVESICVMNNTIEFLNCYHWPPRVVVRALNLLKLTIAKYLSPNMALLLEEDNDSTLCMMATTLNANLCDMHWEVRDSTLEVFHTIANISNIKYPLFQKLLLKMDVIPLLVTMCTSDTESFVRASAIKCLQEMIKVQAFWSQVLVNQELPQKMIRILKSEPEAIVRTEAAALMRHIHEYQHFANELMSEVYVSMSWSATHDLHWEVKSNALDFWGKVVLNHLQEQGYIDGKFPHVTFSKEKRKIVQLTEPEVRQRVLKVLEQLSDIGCLDVLMQAVQEDCDIEVAKKAMDQVKKMQSLLTAYNVYDAFAPFTPLKMEHHSEQKSQDLGEREISTRDGPIVISDEILDQIINSDDLNLLSDVFNNDSNDVVDDNGSKEQLFDEWVRNGAKRRVTADVFVNFTRQDLDSIIDSKCDWINKMDSLGSLLDDMLKRYDDDVVGVNTMDCY